MQELPYNIYFEKTRGSLYKLFVDGKRVEITGWATSKAAFKRYFKKNYGVDLITDARIKKNYKEFSIKKFGKNKYIKIEIKPV